MPGPSDTRAGNPCRGNLPPHSQKATSMRAQLTAAFVLGSGLIVLTDVVHPRATALSDDLWTPLHAWLEEDDQ